MKLVLSLCLFVASTAAMAEAIDGLYTSGEYRGYKKRDRIQVLGGKTVAPAQLHEVYGTRVEAGVEVKASRLNQKNLESEVVAPSVLVNTIHGGDRVALGLALAYTQGENSANDVYTETFKTVSALPQVAYFFNNNLTIGAGASVNRMQLAKGVDDSETTDTYELFWVRPAVSFAYHNPKMEIGIKYEDQALKSDTEVNADIEGSLSLATPSTSEESVVDLYIPAQTNLYVRGNLTDAFSLMANVGLSRYDANVEGAVGRFEQYDTADRTTATLQGTLWSAQERSRISLAALYLGGATAEAGLNQNGQSYRMANQYGANLSGAISWSKLSYLATQVGYLQGELDETVEGQDYKAREKAITVATSYTKKF